ncbi:MAG: sulfite exporter TauE/SafE family protein [Gammaproteobacteria bacterium]
MTEPLTLAAALLAGLAGSAHCLAMCGGIAGALGGGSARPARNALLLAIGRVSGYMIAGALVGTIGAALATPPVLRVAFGVVLILIGIRTLTATRGPQWLERIGTRFWMRLAPLAGRLARRDGVWPALGLGLIWGWLPCGLVYAMLGAAAVAGSALNGALVMGAFGVGTVPAVAGVVLLAGRGGQVLRSGAWRRVAGAALVVFGVWTAAVPIMNRGAEHRSHIGSPQDAHWLAATAGHRCVATCGLQPAPEEPVNPQEQAACAGRGIVTVWGIR